MSESAPLAAGFLLGLSTGPMCLATCFPVVLPFAISNSAGTTPARRWAFFGKFVAGRFFAYVATGCVVGAASARLGFFGSRVGVYAWAVLSLVLIAYGLGARSSHISLCKMAGRVGSGAAFPFLLGIMTGFSVCPPFLLALSYVVEHSANPLFGAVFFLSFFCATTLYVIPLGILGHLPRKQWLDNVGRLAAVVAGAFFFCEAVLTLLRLG